MVKKTRSVSRDKLPSIAASLKAKAKTPNTLTLEGMVKELTQEIQEMLDAGYAYEDVAALFAEHSVEIAPSSIKSYHRKQKSGVRNPKSEEVEQARLPESQHEATHASPTSQPAEEQAQPQSEAAAKPDRKSKQDKASPAKTAPTQFNVSNRDEL